MTLTYHFTIGIVDTATAEIGCTRPLTIDVEEPPVPPAFTNTEIEFCCTC